MKIVFMGTPDFAVPALQRLYTEHEVICVYTRAPKPAGRGNKINVSPVHKFATDHKIEVRTPSSLRSDAEQQSFIALQADVAVVAAYGLILPESILESYPLGCINIHASLLPRWRGAAPIQRCLEAGDIKSGVTIMQVAAGLDTGDMLLKGEIPITLTMTGGELHDKLADLGADLIAEVLRHPQSYPPHPQNEADACYAQKLEKNECCLDFNQPRSIILNKIRAFSPYPAVFFEYRGERFKILRAQPTAQNLKCGEISSDQRRIFIGCADGAIEIQQIQRQGKKAMTAADLLRGYTFTHD